MDLGWVELARRRRALAHCGVLGHGVDELGRKALHVVPEQADAVRWAADAVLSGWSLTAVADELTERGHRGAQGARLRTSSVRCLLTSPTVAGLRVHQGEILGGEHDRAHQPEQLLGLRKR